MAHRPARFLSVVVFAACAAATGAAESAPEPVQFVGADPVIVIRVHDVSRSLQRLQHSPYPALAATAWGARAMATLQGAITPDSAPFDLPSLAASIRSAAIGIGIDDANESPDIRAAVATAGDAAPMRAWCRSVSDGELAVDPGARRWHCPLGQIVEAEGIFAFRTSRIAEELTPVPSPASGTPCACIELTADPRRLARVLMRGDVPTEPEHGGARLAIGLALDPIGVREHWDIPLAGPMLPAARVELFDSLPATTLMACTFHADPVATNRLLAAALGGEPLLLLRLQMLMARSGLPPLQTLCGAFEGDTLIYCEEGAPFPYVTLAADMSESVARDLLPALALGVGLAQTPDGALTGFLGKVPFQAGYEGGRLVLTTNPQGVSGFARRQGGFTVLPDAKDALAEIPAGAVFAGISRSGAASSALARTALMPFAHSGVPQLAAMPQDLLTRGRHGFIAITQVADGTRVDAGGLLGGPLSSYVALGGAAYMNYLRAMRAMELQMRELRERQGLPSAGVGKTM